MIAGFGERPTIQLNGQLFATESPPPSSTTESSVTNSGVSLLEEIEKQMYKKGNLYAATWGSSTDNLQTVATVP